MVKLTEVEDEHFTAEKPVPSKNDALLVSDDEEDYTDTGKYLKNTCSPAQPANSDRAANTVLHRGRKTSMRVKVFKTTPRNPDKNYGLRHH